MSALDDLFSGNEARAQAALHQITMADLPGVQAALTGSDPEARWWAVGALSYLPSPEATTLLISVAADPDVNLRAAALHALGQHATPVALLPLLFALSDPSPYLTRIATDALIQLGALSVPDLIRVLEADAQSHVRVNAARALALIGDKRAIPALFAALKDESVMVQYWAEEGLERMGVGQMYFKP